MDNSEISTETKPMSAVRQKRNWRFDYLKGICCIVVILSHCPAPGKIGEAIIYGCKFAVPIFFMITGYYTETKDNKWIFDKIKQLLTKLIIAELLYGIWKLLVHIFIDNKSIQSFIEEMSIVNHPIRVFFCGSLFNGVFWYFYGIIWSYILIVLLRKIKLIYSNIFCIITALSLISIHIIVRFILQNLIDYSNYTFLFRNGLFFGFPLVLTGMLFSRYENIIREKISLRTNIIIFVSGIAIMVLEFILSGQYLDFHYSSYIISIAIFMFAFVYSKENIIFKKPLSFMGHYLSLWIYIDHMFVASVLEIIADKLSLSGNLVYEYISALLVIILSILMAFLIYSVKKALHNQKNKST